MYLALTYAGGGDMLQMIESNGKIEAEAAQLSFAEIVSALCHLHQRNIIYRDLKPEVRTKPSCASHLTASPPLAPRRLAPRQLALHTA